MPSPFVNVVFLYGKHVCKQLKDILRYCSTIVDEREWSKFLFVVLDSEKPVLPADISASLGNNCMFSSAEDANADSIINAVMDKKAGVDVTSVRIQCLCQASEDDKLPVSRLRLLVEQTRKHFETSDVSYLLYLLLEHGIAQRERQKDICTQMQQDKPNATYLISTVNNRGASVSMDAALHAACSEMLANAYSLRVLNAEKKLYSLGSSTLNANDGELTALLEYKAVQWLLAEADSPISDERAWQLITNQTIPHYEPTGMRAALNSWLDLLCSGADTLRLPNESERKTARILGCVYERELSDISKAVARFYELNAGSDEQVSRAAEALAMKVEHDARSRIARLLNAGKFPLAIIDTMVDGLNTIADMPVTRTAVQLPEKTLKMRLNPKLYIDECCRVMEEARERDVREEFRRALAKSLSRHMVGLHSFVDNAKTVIGVFAAQSIDAAEAGRLEAKYPLYAEAITRAVDGLTLEFRRAITENTKHYFLERGEPSVDAVKALIAQLSARVEEKLPQEFKTTFCNALAYECRGDGKLEGFFNEYLVQGERMFHSIHDVPGVPASLYVTDAAFMGNAWVKEQDYILPARNDNIERIDLYTLSHTLEEYQNDPHSNYFTPSTATTSGGFETLGGYAETAEEKAEPKTEQAVENARKSHGLTSARNAKGKYVLGWEWKPKSSAAVVILKKDGKLLGTKTVTSADFYAGVDGVGQRVDVTDLLKVTGAVNVEVSYDGAPYAFGEITGMQSSVLWKRTMNRDRKMIYTLEGNPSDISKVVMVYDNTYYPIYATASPQSFEGIPGNLTPSTNPNDAHPSICVIQKK